MIDISVKNLFLFLIVRCKMGKYHRERGTLGVRTREIHQETRLVCCAFQNLAIFYPELRSQCLGRWFDGSPSLPKWTRVILLDPNPR